MAVQHLKNLARGETSQTNTLCDVGWNWWIVQQKLVGQQLRILQLKVRRKRSKLSGSDSTKLTVCNSCHSSDFEMKIVVQSRFRDGV